MLFDEISPEDFLTFSRVAPPHVKIEQYLIELGGSGVQGAEFKKKALQKAGWSYGALISYGAHPNAAAIAFNFVRSTVGTGVLDSEQILEQLALKKVD